MTKYTVHDVAAFMQKRLREEDVLYQEIIVFEIQEQYGEEFVYINENGNLAINRKVLAEFQKLTKDQVVWSRGERYWRFRKEWDNSKSRMIQ